MSDATNLSPALDEAIVRLRQHGFRPEADAVETLRTQSAAAHLQRCQREGEAMDAAIGEARLQREARAFVEFVLRHTWPERAFAHGLDAVYGLIKHHPFAKAHGPSQEQTP